MPLPSIVLVVNVTVAPGNVLQHIPRAVIADPPSDVIFPPPVAVVSVIADIAVVLIDVLPGFRVVKVSFLP